MQLTDDDVRRLGRLARIRVTDEEAGEIGRQLSGIFGLIEQLQAVDTAGIVPMSHSQEFALRLRPDEVTETDRHEAFQAVAPQVENGLYLVPRVIE